MRAASRRASATYGRPAPVDLDDVARELDPRAAVVGHRHLEDAAGADREEVRVLRVVVDDPPLRAEELDAVGHALGRRDIAATQAGLAPAG